MSVTFCNDGHAHLCCLLTYWACTSNLCEVPGRAQRTGAEEFGAMGQCQLDDEGCQRQHPGVAKDCSCRWPGRQTAAMGAAHAVRVGCHTPGYSLPNPTFRHLDHQVGSSGNLCGEGENSGFEKLASTQQASPTVRLAHWGESLQRR